MAFYHITDLEKLTGIKAHTIRIWEKRYDVIKPHRTDTNIRTYDDEQARKLLNIATLLRTGMKISRIAELSDREISALITRIHDHAPEDVICDTFINELISAMLKFDEASFEKVFSSSVTRYGIFNAMLNVFYPFLVRTGILWTAAELLPVQEHFASTIVKRKLMAAIDGLPIATKKNRNYLLFLPPGEWHDNGLLMAEYLLRSKGYPTLSLGQNVPVENLKFVVSAVKPTHVLTFYVARQDIQKIKKEISQMTSVDPKVTILISGSPNILAELKDGKKYTLLHTPADLAALL
jgi:DNA-binding transcriptional MerR regulator